MGTAIKKTKGVMALTDKYFDVCFTVKSLHFKYPFKRDTDDLEWVYLPIKSAYDSDSGYFLFGPDYPPSLKIPLVKKCMKYSPVMKKITGKGVVPLFMREVEASLN